MVDNLPDSLENVTPFMPQDYGNDLSPNLDYIYLDQYLTPDLSHLEKPPTLDEVESSHAFEVHLPGESSGKSTWIYSSTLKKVFIKMNNPFTVQINYKNPEIVQQPGDLFLRIIPVFTEPEDQHNPVNRCKHHHNEQFHHIFTCKNQSAIHHGTSTETSYEKRLCAIIPQSSTAPEVRDNITLEFNCQNSCATGINRRSTALIFSLETAGKEIVGKRLVYFKVCSCPKRDKMKEEEAEMQKLSGVPLKRRAEDPLAPKNGKRPCKIIVKQEIKQEYSPPTVPPSNLSQLTPMQMTPSYNNETMDVAVGTGVSYTLRVANHEALLQILKSAADVHCVMAADARDEQTRQQLMYFRENLMNERENLEGQLRQYMQ